MRIALPIVLAFSFLRLLLQSITWSASLKGEQVSVDIPKLAGVRLAVPAAHVATTPPRHLLEPGRHIDWAFVRGSLQPNAGKVLQSVKASDHLPNLIRVAAEHYRAESYVLRVYVTPLNGCRLFNTQCGCAGAVYQLRHAWLLLMVRQFAEHAA